MKANTRPGVLTTARLVAVLAAAVWLGSFNPGATADDFSNPEVAVQAGKEALQANWNLPWYDSSSDGYKPVDLPPPRKPSSFWKWLDSLFSGWNLNLSELLTFLGWVVVVGLLTWIVVALIRAYQQAELTTAVAATDQHDARAQVQRIQALPVSIDEPVGDFLQAARRAYDTGDLTRAIVYLFSFELLELDRAARLRLVKGKTNRQYLRELRRGAAPADRLSEILSRTVGIFEAAFFGAHKPTQDAFENCWEEASEFQRLLVPAEEGRA